MNFIFRQLAVGSPPSRKQAADQTMVNGEDGSRNRGERELGKVARGERDSEAAVLHAHFDGNGAAASTGNHAPASQWVSSGVAKMATMVEHIVSKTLRGTLALARCRSH